MIPIPRYMQSHREGLKNFSLHFDYFSEWDDNLKARIEHHVNAAGPIMRHADAALKGLHRRQSACLGSIQAKGGVCLEITAKLQAPFVSGLGGCHPTETGFILDRNSGLPYIPASAVKGVLRVAHALDIAEQYPERVKETRDGFEIDNREETMRKYFGDTDTSAKDAVRGQLVFLDAFPASLPTIKRDIMNPHFAPYYKGDAPPRETDSPIPVMFMAVKEGVEFKFRVFALPLAVGASVPTDFTDDDRSAIVAMFSRACMQLGFGAKTSIGYGRMCDVRDTTSEMVDAWKKTLEDKHPWKAALRELEGVADWGGFRQKGLESEILVTHRDKPEVAQRVFELAGELRKKWKSGWEQSRDDLIAEWLRPAGLSWPPVEEAAPPIVNPAISELERIKGMKKWADYLAEPANLDVLSKNGLKTLREKLKGWGCDVKDAKPDKKAAWDELMRKMKNG